MDKGGIFLFFKIKKNQSVSIKNSLYIKLEINGNSVLMLSMENQ